MPGSHHSRSYFHFTLIAASAVATACANGPVDGPSPEKNPGAGGADGGADGGLGDGGNGAGDKACPDAFYKECAGKCVLVADPNYGCGRTTCGACASPPHAASTCLNGQCVWTSCAPGWVDCDGAPENGCEVFTQTDPDNCNACGRSCLGSTCELGVCKPTVLAEGELLYRLAIDDLYVYYIELPDPFKAYGYAIKKVSKAGGDVTTLAAIADPTDTWAHAIAVDDDGVYWRSYSHIFKVGKNGGDPTVLASASAQGLLSSAEFVLDATNVYWAEAPGDLPGGIRTVAKSGGSATTLVDLAERASIAINAKYCYALLESAEHETFVAVPFKGGPTNTFLGDSNSTWAYRSISNLAVDSTNAYWGGLSGSGLPYGLRTRPLAAGAFTSFLVPDTLPLYVASHMGRVYWSPDLGISGSQILMVPKDGGVITTIARYTAPESNEIFRFAVDDAFVYWVKSEKEGAKIVKAPGQ